MIVRGESTIIDYNAPFDQGLRDFPQSKLDSEINAPFLLTSKVTYIFYYVKNIVHIILFNFLKI